MDPIHAAYATSDPLFYDRPRVDASGEPYSVPSTRPWARWTNIEDRRWSHWLPPASSLPSQGWKVHVSAIPDSADQILRRVAEYCNDRAIAFKFLRTDGDLENALAKDADRGSAGKFITVYPTSEQALRELLSTLDRELGGLPGPYILSDLRWNNGPLYVRYGAFIMQTVHYDGIEVPAVRDLSSGALVPDSRGAAFVVPSWVTVPDFLADQVQQLSLEPPAWFPAITGALHHSNAGGVYAGHMAGRDIVLKEARPHAGRTPDGRDARERLAHEAITLKGLPDDVPAPRIVGSFELHGHEFLALALVNGEPLSRQVTATNPLGSLNTPESEYGTYRAWSLAVADELRTAVDRLHQSGRTHGDLHPGNVLVDAENGLTLIDFEMSLPIGTERAAAFGVPGFVAPGTEDPVGRDRFAVACIELHMFLPLSPLLQLDPAKARELPAQAASLFGLPQSWAEELSARLEAGLVTASQPSTAPVSSRSALSTSTIRDIVSTLARDADPAREDRLWPGDPRQFDEELFAVAHGALGVAVALDHVGDGPGESAHSWISAAVTGRSGSPRLGLMDGLAGAVWACRAVGWTDLADDLLAELAAAHWQLLGPDLYSGTPGVALTLLAESERHPALMSEVAEAVGALHSYWAAADPRSSVTPGRGGLLRGASGTALLALRMYDATGERTFLDAARAALDFDVASLVAASDGSLHVNEGWRFLPYLGFGSAGIGLVIAQYQTVDHRQDYADVLERIVNAACTPFTAQVGLLQGRAGLMCFLAELDRLGLGTPDTQLALARHSEQLALHALSGGDRFVGDGLLRASCDLSTGSAGVLIALHAASHPTERALLPWMQSTPRSRSASERTAPQKGGETDGVPAFASNAGTRGR